MTKIWLVYCMAGPFDLTIPTVITSLIRLMTLNDGVIAKRRKIVLMGN